MPKKELSNQAIEARRAYYRDYHKKNPGKNREYKNRYWERKAAQNEVIK